MTKTIKKTDAPEGKASVELASGRVSTIDRAAMLCIVYLGQIGDLEDPVEHTSPAMFHADAGPGLTLEAGATMVTAGLWADHVDGGNDILLAKVERGEIEVYETAEEVLDLPIGELRKILSVTRHGAVLRLWEVAEAKRDRPRAAIVDALRERLRLYRDHAPPRVADLSHIRPMQRPERKAS